MNPEVRPRRPLWFRLSRSLFFTLVTLATLLALLWAFENWRGERQWQALMKSYAAKGDPLDAPAVIPATVADDQNVAMTPLLRPLLDYELVRGQPVWRDTNAIARMEALVLPTMKLEERGSNGWVKLSNWQSAFRATNAFPLPSTPGTPAADILSALGRWKAELDELEAATRRPYARFNTRPEDSLNAIFPILARGKAISRILSLRCAARLASGDTAGALSDIEFNERWAHAMSSDPLLINQLVTIAVETIGTSMAWQGLAEHRWNDAQLAQLQSLFEARKPREDMLRALRGERAFGLAIMDRWVSDPETRARDLGESGIDYGRRLPRGWVRQNQISMVRLHELLAEQSGRWASGNLPSEELGSDPVEQLKKDRPWFYRQLTVMLAPALIKAMAKADRLVTISRMAAIVCGLERYRLAHQAYPESLDALVPTFIQTLPLDPCNGKAFRYQRVADGSFHLYSLGPNGRDDGGVFVPDDAKSDWLWPLTIDTPKRMF